MLISNQHQFIFVHVPKTAGLSIGRALEPYASIRSRHGFRRLMSHLPLPEPEDAVAFRLHVSARWARIKLPADVFNSYRKFAVVRNPYDLTVSLYHYLSQQPDNRLNGKVSQMSFMSFVEFLARSRQRRKYPTQLSFVSDGNGKIIVDHILRFETLNQDFASLCRTLGLPDDVGLPMRNASEHKPYWEYYIDEDTRKLTAEIFADDFRAFGYSTDMDQLSGNRVQRLVA